MAMEQGWYGDRRLLQQGFIVGIVGLGIITMISLGIFFFQVIHTHMFAIGGICLLIVFVLIRALSFHDMDSFLGSYVFLQ